jgi:hypothetical protein
MNTVNISIKKTMLAMLALTIIGSSTFAQDTAKSVRNFGGLYGGVDLTQTSGFTGIMYEYMAFRGKGKEIGLTFHYTFAYRGGNLIGFYEDETRPRMSSYGVGFTGYLFTNPQKNNKGFFISGELGVRGTGWLAFPGFSNFLRPRGGLGFGWKWITPTGKAIRLNSGLSYTGSNLFTDAGLTAAATLSFGF